MLHLGEYQACVLKQAMINCLPDDDSEISKIPTYLHKRLRHMIRNDNRFKSINQENLDKIAKLFKKKYNTYLIENKYKMIDWIKKQDTVKIICVDRYPRDFTYSFFTAKVLNTYDDFIVIERKYGHIHTLRLSSYQKCWGNPGHEYVNCPICEEFNPITLPRPI